MAETSAYTENWESVVQSETPPDGELAYELRAWLADADVTDLWRALRAVHLGSLARRPTLRSSTRPGDLDAGREGDEVAG